MGIYYFLLISSFTIFIFMLNLCSIKECLGVGFLYIIGTFNFLKLYKEIDSLHGCIHSMKKELKDQNSGIKLEIQALPENINTIGQPEINFNTSCCICKNNPISHIVLPCLHLCLCGVCSIKKELFSNNCPICKNNMVDIKKVFVA